MTAALTPAYARADRAGTPALVGALCYAAAGVMGIGALAGAYVSAKHGAGKDWLVPAMKFNNYAGVLGSVSMLIASIGAAMAVSVSRFNHRRWMAIGFGLAVFMCLATMNLIWLIGSGLGFGVGEHPYGSFVYLLLAAGMIAVGVAAVAAVIGLLRSVTGQIDARDPLLARASSWFVHIGTAAWIAVFAVIFLYK